MSDKKDNRYFREEHEQYVLDYINSEDAAHKREIYERYLHEPLLKMVLGIMRRYGFQSIYMDDESHANRVLEHLYERLDKYTPSKYNTKEEIDTVKHKLRAAKKKKDVILVNEIKEQLEGMREAPRAFSYYQTIVKNQFIKIKRAEKDRQQRYSLSYDDFADSVKHNPSFAYILDFDSTKNEDTIFYDFLNFIEKLMIVPANMMNLSDNERKMGHAIVDTFKNWKTIFTNLHESGTRKAEILKHLREKAGLKKRDMEKALKVFMELYQNFKNNRPK